MKNFVFTLFSIVLLGCSDDDNVTTTPVDNPEFRSYITATVDGEDYNASVPFITNNSEYQQLISYQEISDNEDCININYQTSIVLLEGETEPLISIGFIGFLSENNIICTEELLNFETLFTQEQYVYANDTSGYGATIRYEIKVDNVQQYYTSYLSDQSNSFFEITEVEIEDCEPKSCVRVTGIFNCTLYNIADSNDTVEITEGTFKLKLLSFN